MGRCTVEVHSWLYTGKLQRQDCPQIRDIRTQLLASSQNFVFGIVDGCTGRTERRWQHWSPPEGSLTESHGCSHGCILLGKPQTHCSNTRLHTLISPIWKRTNFSSTFSSQAEVQSENNSRTHTLLRFAAQPWACRGCAEFAENLFPDIMRLLDYRVAGRLLAQLPALSVFAGHNDEPFANFDQALIYLPRRSILD